MIEFQSIKEKVKHDMVTIPEHIQTLLIYFEHQAGTLHFCRFVLPVIHKLVAAHRRQEPHTALPTVGTPPPTH